MSPWHIGQRVQAHQHHPDSATHEHQRLSNGINLSATRRPPALAPSFNAQQSNTNNERDLGIGLASHGSFYGSFHLVVSYHKLVR